MDRDVVISGIGLLSPAGIGQVGATGGRPGEVPGFRPRAYVADRKQLKLMSRAVRLGVSGVRLAVSAAGGDELLEDVTPARRGIYVGATPQAGEAEDLRPALEASTTPAGDFSMARFAQGGTRLIHPLWLVKGLSNNVLGFASAFHNLQGCNANYCDGDEGGWIALCQGARAVADGRADWVVAGAGDCMLGIDGMLGGRRCGEGAAFFVFRPASQAAGISWTSALREGLDADEYHLGYIGAATWPVALARELLSR